MSLNLTIQKYSCKTHSLHKIQNIHKWHHHVYQTSWAGVDVQYSLFINDFTKLCFVSRPEDSPASGSNVHMAIKCINVSVTIRLISNWRLSGNWRDDSHDKPYIHKEKRLIDYGLGCHFITGYITAALCCFKITAVMLQFVFNLKPKIGQ